MMGFRMRIFVSNKLDSTEVIGLGQFFDNICSSFALGELRE